MKKYTETMNKIYADEELKERIVNKAAASSKADEKQTEKEHKKIINNPRVKKWMPAVTAVAAAVIIALSFVLYSFVSNIGLPNKTNDALTPVSVTRAEIVRLLKTNVNNSGNDYWLSGGSKGDVAVEAPSAAENDQSGSSGSGDYAKTNVQHEGIDEGDIIKVDDNYIYVLSPAGLIIISVADNMAISSKLEYENFYPDEMFILGDKLVVIGGVYERFAFDTPVSTATADVAMCCEPLDYWRSYTKIVVYDVTDRADLKTLTEYNITGYFITSRLIENELIVSINHSVYYNKEETYFPKINGVEIDAEDIYLFNTNDHSDYKRYYSYYSVLVSIDLSGLDFDFSAFLGLTGISYFSKDNVYFFNPIYITQKRMFSSWDYFYKTIIVKIGLKDLKFIASQKIDGYINDNYWADEYESNLRVVSYCTNYQNDRSERFTKVYVLDGNLEILGTITNIAPNESIYSVRFNKNEGSIVTFLQIDPLFKLDLSDPRNPKISKGLKEEGVSDYLQYLSDDIILGLGRNMGIGGMKIALYDNRGADAVNIKTIDIGGGYAYSEALYNPKAILNDTAKNMFSFPVTMSGGSWAYTSKQGLAVFEYNLDAENDSDKLIYRGLLTNLSESKQYSDWYDYYNDYYSYVKRGARIGNKMYTISEKYIVSYDLATLQQIESLQIADFNFTA